MEERWIENGKTRVYFDFLIEISVLYITVDIWSIVLERGLWFGTGIVLYSMLQYAFMCLRLGYVNILSLDYIPEIMLFRLCNILPLDYIQAIL